VLARFEVMEDDCIGCGLCKERAPENFEVIAEKKVARVFAQPSNADEEEACLEAADFCPIGAMSVLTPETSDEPLPAVAAGSS